MATSRFPTTNYAASHLVESAGGIVFSRPRAASSANPSSTPPSCSSSGRRRICILFHLGRGEHLLAKGRRDHGESRAACALREVREESGVQSLALLPVRLPSRATPAATGDPNTPDEVRVFARSTEPFMCSVRDLGDLSRHGREVKLIWWFVMQADDCEADGDTGEDGWLRKWCAVDEALRLLTYEADREVVRQAVALVQDADADGLRRSSGQRAGL